MLKGKGIIVSVVLHVLLLLLLSVQFSEHQKNNMPPEKIKTAIKSFLYTPFTPSKIEAEQNLETLSNEKTDLPQKTHQDLTIIKRPLTTIQETIKEEISIQSMPSNSVIKKVTRSSLKSQIESLNNNDSKYQSTYQKKYAVKSIFNQNPVLVPKSFTRSELQKEEAKKRQITNYGNGIAIQKNKNGNCSITQDLSFAGVSSVQYFKCGKSEFDKNFDNHISKAMKKYK